MFVVPGPRPAPGERATGCGLNHPWSAAAKVTFKGAQVRDFRILEGAWDVAKNGLGIPLSRSLLTLTIYQKDQACTLVGSQIKETYEGNGYGAPQFLDASDSRLRKQAVPCELVAGK